MRVDDLERDTPVFLCLAVKDVKGKPFLTNLPPHMRTTVIQSDHGQVMDRLDHVRVTHPNVHSDEQAYKTAKTS